MRNSIDQSALSPWPVVVVPCVVARAKAGAIRPEISQDFIESNTDGRPFSREHASADALRG